MKKLLVLMLAAALALSLVACGGGGDNPQNSGSTPPPNAETTQPGADIPPEETPGEDEERDVTGTYENISLFLTSTYEWRENGSYDKTNPDEKGTYVVSDKGDVIMSENRGSGGDTFTPYGDYYYRSNLICGFEKDNEYGLAPSFDENGRSSQTFDAFYERITNDQHHYLVFTMNEDGTFILKDMIRSNTQGIVDEGDTFEGEYVLNDDILTLKWNGIEVPFLYIDGKIYFDIIEKQTEETAQKTEERHAALQAAQDEKYAPVDDALANEVSSNLQGEWEYTDSGLTTTLLIDGNNITVTASAGGSSISNQGTYIVCKDFVLITYETGKRAKMAYDIDNGEFSFYPLQGIEDGLV